MFGNGVRAPVVGGWLGMGRREMLTKEAGQEWQTSKDSHILAARSLLPVGVKISRKIPPLLRSCCLTVLEPVTLVSGCYWHIL